MMVKGSTKNRLIRAVFGCLFAIMGIFGVTALAPATSVYAETVEETTTTESATENNSAENNSTEQKEEEKKSDSEETKTEEKQDPNAANTSETPVKEAAKNVSCKDNLGALGWLVCPVTGKVSEAVDFLYQKIEDILVINPVEIKDGEPIYEIWKYMRSLTNIVFIIFFLIVICSQVSGIGISNYGIKKTLPKIIVVAIILNLSFIICSLLVDASNVFGNGLRGLFASIEVSTMQTMKTGVVSGVSMSNIFLSLASGGIITVGALAVAVETGAIWMLIPVALGALASVVSGLITIALRQAVVSLLIMISPLAVVAYMLPNTEDLFKKWKKLFIRMLVFYPMFSALFGASSLAGWAIITSAKTGFGLMLGVAVQIFPLFFSWSLMKMSGTFLSTINEHLRGLAAKPLAANRAWADSHRQLSKQKHLASNRPYTPSLRLMQYLNNRRVMREEETAEHANTARIRAQRYAAMRHYNKDLTPNKHGEEAYEEQARNMRYQKDIEWHKNNMNGGFGGLASVQLHSSEAQKARLRQLDIENVEASDELKMELARGAKIEYENAKGYHKRISDAIDARDDLKALEEGNTKHQSHGALNDESNLARFNTMRNIMGGNELDTGFIAADAAHAYSAQAQIVRGKFQDYFDYTGPTQDVVNRLNQLTRSRNSNDYIDPIIAGLRTLNMRGDTDLAREQVSNLLRDEKVELGTRASQSLANYFLFDVKGSDPMLRRFGKYINLETAALYNEGDTRRTRKDVSLEEYINGEYIDHDENGNVLYEDNGMVKMRKPKKGGASELLKGTSFKEMERTAIKNMNETIRLCSYDTDENGNKTFNYEKFKKNSQKIWDAIMPNIISDQYSFLSGGEQIIALGKGLTGIDVDKHGFDWKGIFGKEVADSLTDEQKKDYAEVLNKRVGTFLEGHVPVQIAKTKTDMLEAIRTQYALMEELNSNPEFMDELGRSDFKMSKDEYGEIEDNHIEDIRDKFVNSFKEDALKGFVKMYSKGYQGEAKDKLIKLLDPESLYKKYFPDDKSRGRNNQRRSDIDDDDEDGAPILSDTGDETPVDGGYTDTSASIEQIFNGYNNAGRRHDVDAFWNDIRGVIESSAENHVNAARLDDIQNNELSQYTDVASFYNDVVRRLLGLGD